jgi:hypothetical protein
MSKVETKPEEIKKRGRKPNGGKIINKTPKIEEEKKVEIKSNVILHLKCFLKELNTVNYNCSNNVKPYEGDETSVYKYVKETEMTPEKSLVKKIKDLEHNLHLNNMNDKKSCCFHCTYSFDNTPCYIPKAYINDGYQVYGCFCIPECAVAYLFNENIDSDVKFERYAMLNYIYGKSVEYKKNIKPAPSPYYTLDKYYGTLTIQEYRSLMRTDRYFSVVDKPLTKIMPELYEDNNEHIIHNKFMNTNLKLKQTKNNKTTILNETFGLGSGH